MTVLSRRAVLAGAAALWLVARAGPAVPQTAQPRWESAIRTFERRDVRHPPEADAVLFVGSSSIRRWRSLADDFSPRPVLNRGFGGATMQDILTHQARVVFPYSPAAIVLYGGENDIVAGAAPEVVVDRVRSFVDRNKGELGPIPHILLTSKVAPARLRYRNEIAAFNRLLIGEPQWQACVTVLDAGAAVADGDGHPIETMFAADRLHLNAAGYARWSALILSALPTV